MVLISHKYKFIYIKNVKVAGTSVESFFGQFLCKIPKIPIIFFINKKQKLVNLE